jgi:hypothetical protein
MHMPQQNTERERKRFGKSDHMVEDTREQLDRVSLCDTDGGVCKPTNTWLASPTDEELRRKRLMSTIISTSGASGVLDSAVSQSAPAITIMATSILGCDEETHGPRAVEAMRTFLPEHLRKTMRGVSSGMYDNKRVVHLHFASVQDRATVYKHLCEQAGDGARIIFFRSRSRVDRGGTKGPTKKERIMLANIRAMSNFDALHFVEKAVRLWAAEYDDDVTPDTLFEPIYLQEVQLTTQVRSLKGKGGSYKVWVSFRNEGIAKHFVRDATKKGIDPHTQKYFAEYAGVSKDNASIWERTLKIETNGGLMKCVRCGAVGHDTSKCNVITFRIENRHRVYNCMQKEAIMEMLGGYSCSVSGNYWHGIQPLRNWFLIKLRDEGDNVQKATDALAQLQETGDLTGWDWDNNGGRGKLLSCDRCGTKQVDCGGRNLPRWHSSRDRVNCPRGGSSRNAKTKAAKYWMQSEHDELNLVRMKLVYELYARSATKSRSTDTAERDHCLRKTSTTKRARSGEHGVMRRRQLSFTGPHRVGGV